jgi:hypothetical protein
MVFSGVFCYVLRPPSAGSLFCAFKTFSFFKDGNKLIALDGELRGLEWLERVCAEKGKEEQTLSLMVPVIEAKENKYETDPGRIFF